MIRFRRLMLNMLLTYLVIGVVVVALTYGGTYHTISEGRFNKAHQLITHYLKSKPVLYIKSYTLPEDIPLSNMKKIMLKSYWTGP